MTDRLYCCEPSCAKDADYAIFENRTDVPPHDTETHACADHIGHLLGTPVGRPTETESWVIWPIDVER